MRLCRIAVIILTWRFYPAQAKMSVKWVSRTSECNRSGGGQKNVRYEITRNQYENQSRFDFPRIIVSS